MGIVFGGIAPHGWPLIHELSDDAEGALETRRAMEDLGRRCAAAQPDVLVIASPHTIRVEGAMVVMRVGRGAGTLHYEGRSVEMNVPIDAALTEAVARSAESMGLPVARAGFAGNNLDQSVVPLEWGTMSPLWFLGHGRHRPGFGHVLADAPPDDSGPPIVIVSPARSLPREAHMTFGEAIAEAAAADGRSAAFIASCDWAHTHPGSQYGEHPDAAVVDAAVVEAVRANDLERLAGLDEQAVENAAIDGLWQTLILAGVMRRVRLEGTLIGYEAPEAYATGMIVAAFEPARP
jgi:aromatic ring-opening dioxygenase LigB subunit